MLLSRVLMLALLASCRPVAEAVAPVVETRPVRLVATHATTPLPPAIGLGVEDGWTRFDEADADARTLHVSSSRGRDVASGTAEHPLRSIEAAKERLRSGHGDRLLLQRGDTFDGGLGQWKVSGRDREHPVLVGAFGEGPRPVLVVREGGGVVTHGGGGSPPRIDHVAFVGLHFRAERPLGRTDATGVSWHRPGRDLLIEDCVFERFSTGLVVQGIEGRHENLRLRRSVVVDSFDSAGRNPQGIYVVGTDGVLIEECVFDRNGWMPGIEGAEADIFSHDLYIDTDTSAVVVRGNVIARGASHGVQMRSGGVCERNVLAGNAIALMMAGRAGPRRESAIARDNAILAGRDIDAANPRGWGIDFNDVVSGRIEGNLIAANGDVGFALPLLLNGAGHGEHVHDVEVLDNVIRGWGGPIQVLGDARALRGVVLRGNVVEDRDGDAPLLEFGDAAVAEGLSCAGNRWARGATPAERWVLVAGARRSLESWCASVGDTSSTGEPAASAAELHAIRERSLRLGGTDGLDAFLAAARGQSRATWDEALTARAVLESLRAAHGMPGLPGD